MIYKNQIKFFSTKNVISFIALSMIREVSVNKEFIMHTVRYICDLNVFFFFSPFLFSLFRIYFIMNFTMSNYISIIRSFSNCPCRGWRIQEESICVLTDLYSLIFYLFVYIRICTQWYTGAILYITIRSRGLCVR